MKKINLIAKLKMQKKKINKGGEDINNTNKQENKKVEEYLDNVKLIGKDIPEMNTDYLKDEFIPGVDENGYCDWEYDEQNMWDCRRIALTRVINLINMINTSGLVAVAAIYKMNPESFIDYIEDIYYEDLAYRDFDKAIMIFYEKYKKAKIDYISHQKEIEKNRAFFNALMYKLCEKIKLLENVLDKSTDIYTIHDLLLEIIDELSRVLGSIFLNKNLEDLLVERFNNTILLQWLVDLDELNKMMEGEIK